MANCAIVGINWGDEGKGRMVDLIAEGYDVVIRYQGGNNAGHTVVNEYGEFALHLIPSGIFRPGTVNVLGNGTVIDLEKLWEEMENLRVAGVTISPDNFKISDRAALLFPYHRDQDALEETRLKDAKYGSTKRGIAPAYGDKYMKKAILAGELLHPPYLNAHLSGILEWKNLVLHGVYGSQGYSLESISSWLSEYGEKLMPYICDTGAYLREAEAGGAKLLFEAQLGALRDIDFGIYPYTSSSSPLAAYAPIGAGIPASRVDTVIGIIKAYSTCVGEGPFVSEWFGPAADTLREAGAEYGAATGRPRRVGPLDLVATKYGVMVQGATCLALTKLDILSYMENIPVCTAYRVDGEETIDFPFPSVLADARPVYTTFPGWMEDIGNVRRFENLPRAARDYVEYIETQLGVHIGYVSVGAERDSIIVR